MESLKKLLNMSEMLMHQRKLRHTDIIKTQSLFGMSVNHIFQINMLTVTLKLFLLRKKK